MRGLTLLVLVQVVPAEVSIARDDRIEGAVQEALERLRLGDLVGGRKVAVKPNETAIQDGETTGVTQPDTLRAVLRHLKRLNPRNLVVSGGSGAGETAEVLEASGMLQVLREEDVELVDHNRAPFEAVRLDYGDDPEVTGPQREVVVSRSVLDHEVLVSLAQLKLHRTATVTLTLKNVAMSFPAADHYGHPRADEKHQHAFFEDMHSFIAAMAKRFPIALGIVAGHPAMIGTGPLGGVPVETGLVLAGRDAVAVDATGAHLLGFSAQAVRHIWEAGKLGLGETDTGQLTYLGLSLDEAVRAFTGRAYGRAISF